MHSAWRGSRSSVDWAANLINIGTVAHGFTEAQARDDGDGMETGLLVHWYAIVTWRILISDFTNRLRYVLTKIATGCKMPSKSPRIFAGAFITVKMRVGFSHHFSYVHWSRWVYLVDWLGRKRSWFRVRLERGRMMVCWWWWRRWLGRVVLFFFSSQKFPWGVSKCAGIHRCRCLFGFWSCNLTLTQYK